MRPRAALGAAFVAALLPAMSPHPAAEVKVEFPLAVEELVPAVVGVQPQRLYDSRLGAGRLQRGEIRRLAVSNPSGSSAAEPTLIVTITLVSPSRAGYLRAWPCDRTMPTTVAGHFAEGVTTSHTTAIAVGSGRLCVTASATGHLVVDLVDRITAESRFQPSQVRVVDTAKGLRGWRLPAQQIVRVTTGMADRAGLVTVTAQGATARGYLEVSDCDTWWLETPDAWPQTATLNLHPGVAVSNVVPLPSVGSFCVWSQVPTDVIVDSVGWFEADLVVTPRAPLRWIDTRISSPLMAGELGYLELVGFWEHPGRRRIWSDISAVDAAGPGHLQVFPCASWPPGTSAVNFSRLTRTAAVLANGNCVRSSTRTHVVVTSRAAWATRAPGPQVAMSGEDCGWDLPPAGPMRSLVTATNTHWVTAWGGVQPYTVEFTMPDGWTVAVGGESEIQPWWSEIPFVFTHPPSVTGIAVVTVTVRDANGSTNSVDIPFDADKKYYPATC